MEPRTVMMYGESGTTKTTQLYHLAKYIRSQTGGKKIRLIQSDPGGYAPFVDSGMIERGEVEIFDYGARKHHLADLHRVGAGFWPRWTKDGKVYPRQIEGSTEYFQANQFCKTTEEEWKGIGAIFVDGVSSTAEILKNHCSDQETGVGFSEAWKYVEEEYTILGLQKGHYAIVQKEIHKFITKELRKLPVDWICYTALVGKGEDRQKGSVYGPQIVGSAATPSAPTWVMDCFHLSQETYEDVKTPITPNASGEKVTRMVAWFKEHVDPVTEGKYLCKPRCMPELMEELYKYFPYGFVPLGYKTGIEIYYKVMEKIRKGMIT